MTPFSLVQNRRARTLAASLALTACLVTASGSAEALTRSTQLNGTVNLKNLTTPRPVPPTVKPVATSITTASGTITSTANTLTSQTVAKLDSAVPQASVGAMWVSIGRSPSVSEAGAAAGRYRVIVLNAWDTAQLREIKRVNPRAIVLVYKCLASTRSYGGAVVGGRDAAKLPTGVGYVQASGRPSWFATDTSGRRIEWGPYPKHWQMAVWDAGYQAAWAKSVTDEVVREGWDGVMADNDMSSLSWYAGVRFAGTSSAAGTDQKLRAGLDRLVSTAGARLNGAGKLLVPNLSDARLDLTRWQRTAAYGGTLQEHYQPRGGASHWRRDTAMPTVPSDNLTLAITHAAKGDLRTMRFAYGSALVRAQGRVAWTVATDTQYGTPEWFAWQSLQLGSAAKPGVRASSGVWTRVYSGGFVAVNPTRSTIKVVVPPGFSASTVTVPALDAAVVTKK